LAQGPRPEVPASTPNRIAQPAMVFVRTISLLGASCAGGAASSGLATSPRTVPRSTTTDRSAAVASTGAAAGATECPAAVARPIKVRPSTSVLIVDEEYSPARSVNCGLGLTSASIAAFFAVEVSAAPGSAAAVAAAAASSAAPVPAPSPAPAPAPFSVAPAVAWAGSPVFRPGASARRVLAEARAAAGNVQVARTSSVVVDSASSWGCSAAVVAAHELGLSFAVAAAAAAAAVAALGLAPPESVPEPGSPVRLGFLLRAEMAKEGQHIQAWRGGRRVLAKAESSRGDRVATCREMQLKNRFGKGFGGL